ncbi:hypothetical protein LCM20_09460 [Halobacillus litoralis]|uniref:hypothetical protein n=1 Tax=Halobacillus litoralis TaxID=45668 RepID=UPI001CD1CB0F|nr:hypothetical protein [Halobacillus litoralis]MCA0970816.1 hypothetical protein [Halobacillus litoralis]
MESKPLPYIMYWIIFGIGILSFAMPVFQEYGIVTTIIVTVICSFFCLVIAAVVRKRNFMYLSGLLFVSPWLVSWAAAFVRSIS